jgi:transposase
MTETTHNIIISHGRKPRGGYRRWSDEQKRQIIAETYVPGTSISVVARRHDVNANQLFQWRKKFADERGTLKEAGLVPIRVIGGVNKAPAVVKPGAIAIELHRGITVRVDNYVDEVALRRVLSVVGQLP